MCSRKVYLRNKYLLRIEISIRNKLVLVKRSADLYIAQLGYKGLN